MSELVDVGAVEPVEPAGGVGAVAERIIARGEPEPLEPAAPAESVADQPWRDSPQFAEAVARVAQDAVNERLGDIVSRAQAYEQHDQMLAGLDPFDENYPLAVDQIVEARVQQAIQPFLEQHYEAQGMKAAARVVGSFTDLKVENVESVVERGSQIFGAWDKSGAFPPQERRQAAEQALRLAAEEQSGPKRAAAFPVPAHLKRMLEAPDKRPGNMEAVGERIIARREIAKLKAKGRA